MMPMRRLSPEFFKPDARTFGTEEVSNLIFCPYATIQELPLPEAQTSSRMGP